MTIKIPVKCKVLGQYDTNKRAIRSILSSIDITFYDKNIDILEPSSGKGNFINILKEYGFKNIVAYEIDKRYKYTGAIIEDFLKATINQKFDLIIGNPPFTAAKVAESYYDKQDSKYKTRFRELLFLEKSLDLLKDNGKLVFIFTSRLFVDKRCNHILKFIYDSGFYINIIKDMSKDIFTNTQAVSSVLIIISKEKSKIVANGISIPVKAFLNNSNYNIYKEKNNYISIKGETCLGDIMIKIRKPKGSVKITAGTIKNITKKNPLYLAFVRVGASSVGRFSLYDPNQYWFNECFYFYKIDKGATKLVMSTLLHQGIQNHIKLISKRTGSNSIRSDELLRLKVV